MTGEELAEVARASGLAFEQVERMARGGHFEVDRHGQVRSVEPIAPDRSAPGPDVPPGVYVFALHSRPGSNRTIYLDFTGHSVEGTASNGGARIDAPAFDDDGDPSTFNEAERAEIVSHETGHNLGLGHDGQPGVSYYTGHTNWAPIMGAGYYQPVSQWSKGEYGNPSNTEDDLAMIGDNGTPRLLDDHPDTSDSVTPLAAGATVTGIITTESDVDVFAVEHPGGTLTVTALPASFGSNLDIRMVVRDAGGAVVATVDPPVSRVSDADATGLDARLSQNLPAGRYTIHLQGTGFGDPASNGYTRYVTLGQYTLSA